MNDKFEKWCLAALLAVFALSVAFELNGSSLGMWNRYVPNSRAIAPVCGIPRQIRSDEWAVFTPMTLAQAHAVPSYPYFNGIPRAAPTDMYSVYAQPVRHPLLVFRPFLAGHVLLGFRRGLAFFWYGRWLALFLAIYGLFNLITDRNRLFSAVASILVVLSPVVQWWGGINGLAEMLVFGSAFVLCLDRFMEVRGLRARCLPTIGMGYSGVAYAFTLYPAAMVPFAYVFGALSLWIVLRRAKGFRLDSGSMLLALAIAAVSVGSVAWYLSLSSDAFHAMRETVYPGLRFDCGGGFRKGFGLSLGSLFFPWTSQVVEDGNPFNRALFLDFFPLGVVLAAFLLFRRKLRDALVVLLLAVSAVLGFYCVTGYSPIVAKLSLLSRSTPPRAFVALSFAQFLLLVRCVAQTRPVLPLRVAIPIATATSGVATVLSHLAYPNYLTVPRLFLVLAVAFLGSILFVLFQDRKCPATVFFAALAVASGGFVNPIQRGDAGVQDSELARSIRAIAETDGGAWIVEGENFPMNQYPLLVGAPTINAGNLYPALERWRNLDPAETAKESWNRYAAGIRFDVRSGAPVSIRMTGFDTFRVECPPDTLPRLGVRHVLSRRDLEPLSGDAVRFLPEVRASGWTVYSVETAEGQ